MAAKISQIKTEPVVNEGSSQAHAGNRVRIVSADRNEKDYKNASSSLVLVIQSYFQGSVWKAAIISILFYGGFLLRFRHLAGKEKSLEKPVTKKTKELREEKIRTEEQAAKLRILLQEKNRLVTNISHEFKTPLTLTIASLAELIEGKYGTLSLPAWQQANISLLNARWLMRLVDQLTDLASLEDEAFRIDLEYEDLCSYLIRTAEPFKAAAAEKNIDFIVEMPRKPLTIQLDPDQFDKIVANLLSNAFKFTPENGTVILKLREKSDVAVISVSDTGPGIEQDHIPRLFDRFYRAEKSGMQPGSGIGLSLAKELTELHGGTLDVDSRVDKGTTFSIRIPLQSGLTGKTHNYALNGTKSSEKRNTLHMCATDLTDMIDIGDEFEKPYDYLKSILIVDDHPEIRTYLRQNLIGTYNVIEAKSGNEAASIIQKHIPDLIISDLLMPDGDGFSLLKEIRRDPQTDFLPVILLTARAEAEDKLRGLEIGADDYITKPFSMREINARIQNLFDQQKRFKQHLVNEKTGSKPKIQYASVKSLSTEQIFLDSVRKAIQSSVSEENFTVEKLAEKVNQSRSNLHRRLTKLTGETPSAMIRRTRLERGAQLLSQGAGTVSEIAYSTGFKNVSHFSRAFREYFGKTPTEYSGSAKDRIN